MAVTVDIDHEVGDLTEYTTTSGADISAAEAAALAGTNWGLNVLIDDTTDDWGRVVITQSNQMRSRVYIDPNTITMANNDAFTFWHLAQSAGSLFALGAINLKYVTGTGYQLTIAFNNDANAQAFFDTFNLTDAVHYVEVHEIRAANDTSADGTVQWWVDGVDQGTSTGFDNYNIMGDQTWRLRIGNINADAGTNGTVFLDQLVANDDGSEIGPFSSTLSVDVNDTVTLTDVRSAMIGNLGILIDPSVPSLLTTGVEVWS